MDESRPDGDGLARVRLVYVSHRVFWLPLTCLHSTLSSTLNGNATPPTPKKPQPWHDPVIPAQVSPCTPGDSTIHAWKLTWWCASQTHSCRVYSHFFNPRIAPPPHAPPPLRPQMNKSWGKVSSISWSFLILSTAHFKNGMSGMNVVEERRGGESSIQTNEPPILRRSNECRGLCVLCGIDLKKISGGVKEMPMALSSSPCHYVSAGEWWDEGRELPPATCL